jgi:DNA repair exonuclease SbcCD nuclease subunit
VTIRFLHLADLHLDSAYGGSTATVERLRQATLEALERAVTFAIDTELDAVLIAGDAFDDDRLGYAARAVFRREVGRLAAAGLSVVYVTGNHDPGTVTGRAAGLRLPPEAVHSVLDGDVRSIVLPGRGGAPAAIVVAAGHATARVTDNLAARMRSTFEDTSLRGDLPTIGLLHSQVGTAAGAEGHQPYAPCSLADLAACGADYWALGHVHVRGRVDRAVPAYYSGNLQGRHAKESGPKGGLLVELDADGLTDEPEFIPFAPVEFFSCSGELPDDAEPEAVAETVAAALDEAASLGNGPVARELVVRLAYGGPLAARDLGADFELAVREEVQRLSGPVFGEILEVELRPGRSENDLIRPSSSQELLDYIEGTPSALREALAVCRGRDATDGSRLEDELLQRLSMGTRGDHHA